MAEINMTLPTDSQDRKNYVLFRGCLRYFPAAIAGVSKISKLGNDKHNPGQELHHARNKSMDHGDCILRHLMDVDDLVTAMERGETVNKEDILNEVSCMAWRALALSQEIHEKFGSPMAPGAKKEKNDEFKEYGKAETKLVDLDSFQYGDFTKLNQTLKDMGLGMKDEEYRITIPKGAVGGGMDNNGSFVVMPDGKKIYAKTSD